MIHRLVMLLLLVPCALVAASGCDGDKDCVTLCEEAQAGDCTIISGSCSSFCSALDGVQDDAGCTSEREAYEECLNREDAVCDTSCGGTESALVECIGNYCVQNLDDVDCKTLVAAGS